MSPRRVSPDFQPRRLFVILFHLPDPYHHRDLFLMTSEKAKPCVVGVCSSFCTRLLCICDHGQFSFNLLNVWVLVGEYRAPLFCLLCVWKTLMVTIRTCLNWPHHSVCTLAPFYKTPLANDLHMLFWQKHSTTCEMGLMMLMGVQSWTVQRLHSWGLCWIGKHGRLWRPYDWFEWDTWLWWWWWWCVPFGSNSLQMQSFYDKIIT